VVQVADRTILHNVFFANVVINGQNGLWVRKATVPRRRTHKLIAHHDNLVVVTVPPPPPSAFVLSQKGPKVNLKDPLHESIDNGHENAGQQNVNEHIVCFHVRQNTHAQHARIHHFIHFFIIIIIIIQQITNKLQKT
jgi:hypothetical protein